MRASVRAEYVYGWVHVSMRVHLCPYVHVCVQVHVCARVSTCKNVCAAECESVNVHGLHGLGCLCMHTGCVHSHAHVCTCLGIHACAGTGVWSRHRGLWPRSFLEELSQGWGPWDDSG